MHDDVVRCSVIYFGIFPEFSRKCHVPSMMRGSCSYVPRRRSFASQAPRSGADLRGPLWIGERGKRYRTLETREETPNLLMCRCGATARGRAARHRSLRGFRRSHQGAFPTTARVVLPVLFLVPSVQFIGESFAKSEEFYDLKQLTLG